MAAKGHTGKQVTANMNPDLFEIGSGRVLGVREKSGGHVEVGVVYLDVLCRGATDAAYHVIPVQEFEARLREEAEEMGEFREIEARDMAGATLDPFNPQSEHSATLLDLFENVVLQDEGYIERLKQHYLMFRTKVRKRKSGRSGVRDATTRPLQGNKQHFLPGFEANPSHDKRSR